MSDECVVLICYLVLNMVHFAYLNMGSIMSCVSLRRKMLCLQKNNTFSLIFPSNLYKVLFFKALLNTFSKWSVMFSLCRLLWSVWWSWPRADPTLASPWLRPCWLNCTVLRMLPGSWCAIAWPPLPCSCQCWAMECWAISWISTRLSDDQPQTSSRNFW